MRGERPAIPHSCATESFPYMRQNIKIRELCLSSELCRAGGELIHPLAAIAILLPAIGQLTPAMLVP